MIRNIPRAFTFFRMDKQDSVRIQEYAGAIHWLKKNVSEPSVVMANDRISGYIPIMTQHYVLFHPSGALQMVSDIELEERYLVSRFPFEVVTKVTIERDVKLFGGAGKALKGKEMQQHFEYLDRLYQENISPHINFELKKYRVSFIVISLDKPFELEMIKKIRSQEVYKDSNLAIFEVLP